VREGRVVGGHRGGGHVVEEDLDEPVRDVSDDPDVVPAFGPGRPPGPGLGDRDAGLAVDEEDAVVVVVGLLGEVDITRISTAGNPLTIAQLSDSEDLLICKLSTIYYVN
jgi:hypothetical protein